MNRTAPLLLLIAVGIAAEGEPAPQPVVEPAPAAETAPAAAAEPAPAAEVPAAVAEPTPAPAPTTQPPAVTPRPARRAGVRVARVAGPPPAWDARARLSAAYDSNALLESDPDEVQADTAVYGGEIAVGWRPIADERDYVKATATASYDRRPQIQDLDTAKLGVTVAGAHQGDTLTTGGSIAASRYWLDGYGAAAEVRGGATLGWLRQGSADLLAAELAFLHFDGDDAPHRGDALVEAGDSTDRSGALVATGWRHWWLLGGGQRIEGGVRAGRFEAETEVETYSLLQPFAGLRLRPGEWELQARLGLEMRTYAAPRTTGEDNELALTLSATASADRRLGGGLSAGAFVGAASRDSSYENRDYDRWQAGLRLTYAIAAEE